MFKKTFYTFLALVTVINLGLISSGFISTNTATEVAPKATTPAMLSSAGGRWIGGEIYAEENKILSGTGDWTITSTNYGDYIITPNSGKIESAMVSINGGFNKVQWYNDGYNNDGPFNSNGNCLKWWYYS